MLRARDSSNQTGKARNEVQGKRNTYSSEADLRIMLQFVAFQDQWMCMYMRVMDIRIIHGPGLDLLPPSNSLGPKPHQWY